MKAALDYLASYKQRLDAVDEPQQLWNDLLDWQYQEHTSSATAGELPTGRHVQRKISEVLLAPVRNEGRLRDEHLPTTATGGFRGLVVLCANPHFNEARNALELELRHSQEANRDFCMAPFTKHLAYFQGSNWWRSVVRFAHTCLAQPTPPTDVWQWACDGHVGAVDLVPFHSSEDRITGLLQSAPRLLDDRGRLRAALAAAAESTVRMVVRLQPKVILAASRTGAVLATHLGFKLVEQGFAARMPDVQVECERHRDRRAGMEAPRLSSPLLLQDRIVPRPRDLPTDLAGSDLFGCGFPCFGQDTSCERDSQAAANLRGIEIHTEGTSSPTWDGGTNPPLLSAFELERPWRTWTHLGERAYPCELPFGLNAKPGDPRRARKSALALCRR
ncbi:hypothetical protein [Variovorax paradoxus]|uniref:hypothetical protein n=1 Tax=Variovorax paradoxus TaxID=34073 RepID=UPI0019343BF5|nr:hypothetical protein INQ48_43510 [Variovorax paradoxus]